MTSVLIYSLAAVLFLSLILLYLLRKVVKSIYCALRCSSLPVRIFAALLLISGAALLFRPHQDAFTGLDVSAYRLMAEAMRQGRPLFGTDDLLLEVPEESRAAFLYRPDMVGRGRTTRDLSYAVDSLKNCKTRPFYYPLLPFTARGFDLMIPGQVADYMAPLLGLLTLLSLMCLGLIRGRWMGMLLAWALFFATPLPIWIFRGWFPEVVSASLLCLVLVNLLLDGERCIRGPLIIALGLMVSYHVSYLVISLPLLLGLLLAGQTGIRKSLSGALLYLAGLIPLFWQTQFICKPYGAATVGSIRGFFQFGATHWLLTVYLAGILIVGLFALIFRRGIIKAVQFTLDRHSILRLILVLTAGLPLICTLVIWRQQHMVLNGLYDAHSAMGLHLEFLLAVLLLFLFLSKQLNRELLIIVLAMLTLPVYLYLKGAEPVGMWSQRRLLGTLILLAPPAICSGSAIFECITKRLKGWRLLTAASVCMAATAAVGLLNAIRWPAPWLLQNEKGSGAILRRLQHRLDGDLTVVDYHPWSVPLAVMPGSRVLGIGPEGMRHADKALPWIAGRAAAAPVFFVSAYQTNAMIEQGIVLTPVEHFSASLPRIQSKRALPAVARFQPIELTLLQVLPEDVHTFTGTLTRVIGDGVLGYRGRWGRSDIPLRDNDGNSMSAVWSREGSGLIGPVPTPGGTVQITLTCAANRMDGKTQTLLIMPPWSEQVAYLEISNSFCRAAVSLTQPEDSMHPAGSGTYRIYSVNPYNPARQKIKGFHKDLGALIHSVEFELKPAD